MSFGLSAAVAEGTPAAPGPSVTVQPGDSWASVRSRMVPLDALKEANPSLDREMLHPGEVVRAPYVPVSELERERAAREAAEQRLDAMTARLGEFEKDRASFETRRREVARAEAAFSSLRGVMIGLVLLVILLLVFLGFVVQAVRAARRKAAEAASRYDELRSLYEGLRRSLQEIDLGLQRRVLSLLHLHGGKVISDMELESSIKPVIDLTRELRKKHERG